MVPLVDRHSHNLVDTLFEGCYVLSDGSAFAVQPLRVGNRRGPSPRHRSPRAEFKEKAELQPGRSLLGLRLPSHEAEAPEEVLYGHPGPRGGLEENVGPRDDESGKSLMLALPGSREAPENKKGAGRAAQYTILPQSMLPSERPRNN